MSGNRFVIIGGDAAGMSAAGMAKRRRPDMEIEVYEMGDYTSYGACGMPYYIANYFEDLNDLVVVTPHEFRENRGLKVFMRHRVEKINPDDKTIDVKDLDTGRTRTVFYDDLLIATGAEPIIPGEFNLDMEGVFALRGLPDAASIKDFATRPDVNEALVVGTGYIGLEMIEALKEAGLTVRAIELAERVAPTFEEEISTEISEELSRNGIEVLLNVKAQKVERSESAWLSVTLSNGETLTTDMIVVGAGVRPRTKLAEAAGVELGVRKAVKVDRRQRTSIDRIWAAGDCCEAYHRLTGVNAYIPLALGANRQGKVAGSNVAGIDAEFPGVLGTAICKVFDLGVARTGLGLKEAEHAGLDALTVKITGNSKPHYYPGAAPITTLLIIEKNTEKVFGVQMIGHGSAIKRIDTWAACLAGGFTLQEINDLDLAYAPPFSPVWDPVLIAAEVAKKTLK